MLHIKILYIIGTLSANRDFSSLNPNPQAPVACNTCPKPEVVLVRRVKRITNRDLVVDYPSY